MTDINAERIYKEISQLADNEKITILSKLMQEIWTGLKREHKNNIYQLKGVGKEIWDGIDAQEYVNTERKSWKWRHSFCDQ